MATSQQWLAKMAKLNVYRAKGGPAPHKPLLLLVLLELAEQGALPAETLPLSPELAFRFCSYWSIVAARRTQKPDVRLPFHHLETEGIWSALDERGNRSPDDRLTRFVTLTSDFAAFCRDPASRDKARRVLIAKYFQPHERTALYTLVGMLVPSDEQIEWDVNYLSPEEAKRASS
jgi:putative restriction endonuclease